ncbi:MAG: HEPN domain-containing protein [Candidatus Hydrogenedentes bacterium]|nr:HEPN domain-containing protein [Candidatus Hydrogenedentota bacterium]
MLDRESVRQLLMAAESDYRALNGMLAGGDEYFTDEAFGLFVQQALEKCLKVWLALNSISYPYTHSLRLLLKMLAETGMDVEPYWDLVDYSVFAVNGRYTHGVIDLEFDREECLERVGRLYARVNQLFEIKEWPDPSV